MPRFTVVNIDGITEGSFDTDVSVAYDAQPAPAPGRGQQLWRTPLGWVCRFEMGAKVASNFITDAQAADWLLHHGHRSAHDQFFGPAGRGPGRPPIGPQMSFRLPLEDVAELEAAAKAAKSTRAVVIRRRYRLGRAAETQ